MNLRSAGGLKIAESYVPKTTTPLRSLHERGGFRLHVLELLVSAIITATREADAILDVTTSDTCQKLRKPSCRRDYQRPSEY